MASAYYSNTQHIDFEYVLAMEDPGMVSMFQAIMASGLEGFLGYPTVIYEAALVDFFENASVRDGVLISTVAGQLVKISEEWFAESFDLPVDGLADLSDIPKDVVFDSRSIVSMSGEPVSLSGKKSQMKVEYRLLCDIMAKSISVKAGSFNAITVEKFLMVTAVVCGVRMNWARVLFNILKKMVTPGSKKAKGFAVQISLLLENIPNLELGESSEFPASKILTEKTVHRYVSLNDKVGAEEAAGAPKPKAVSKKRPAAADFEAPVVKKKRKMKKKSGSSKVNLEIMVVAQEAVPIQMVEPTTAAPAAEGIFTQPVAEDEIPADPPADEVAGVTVDVEAADEGPNEEPAAGDATRINEPTTEPAVTEFVNEEPSTADDVDIIIEQVLDDTAQIIVDEEDQVVRTSGEGNQPAGTAEERHWFDLPYDDLIARWDAERPVVTASDTDEDVETMDVGVGGGDQQVQFSEEEPEDMEMNDELIDADEKMSLDEILLTILAELPFPSSEREVTKITIGTAMKIPGVDEKTWYLASLPQIPVDAKGKELLQLIDPVKGNPPQEHYYLICADIDQLVQLREKTEHGRGKDQEITKDGRDGSHHDSIPLVPTKGEGNIADEEQLDTSSHKPAKIVSAQNVQVYFRQEVRLKDISSFDSMVNIEEQLLEWGVTEDITELSECRSLILYKLLELEIEKLYLAHLANFKTGVASGFGITKKGEIVRINTQEFW
ncbi:hypothetical protein F511_21352 [Dorcoceras hygrometricum]|uniref:Dystroglycan-like n=1 Tax=Dorcoceras hygrometricum TaxID=472368 RepID=A0A2Z7CGL6_9LAMI|nr:hypothetical protein F511_21352 [Dorcoceras hygrometricum]